MIVAVKEGLYLRARQRPLRAAIGFAVGIGPPIVLGLTDSAITVMAYGLLGAVLLLMLPVTAPVEEAVPVHG